VSQRGVITPSEDKYNLEGSISVEDAASLMEVEEDSDCETVPEEDVVGPDPVTCYLCGQAPCDWDVFGEDIWEECNNMKEGGSDNKAVMYHAYKLYTRMRHGVLQRFDHRPLPICVRGEIMDLWPDPNHEYVGFQQAMNDARDD
jgi:hypothetical protein